MEVALRPLILTGRVYKESNVSGHDPYIGFFTILFTSPTEALLGSTIFKEHIDSFDFLKKLVTILKEKHNCKTLYVERHGKMKTYDVEKFLERYQSK